MGPGSESKVSLLFMEITVTDMLFLLSLPKSQSHPRHKEDQETPTTQSAVPGEQSQVLETQLFYHVPQVHLQKMCHGGKH